MQPSDYPALLSNSFLEGKFGSLSAAFQFPLVLSFEDGTFAIRDEKQLLRVLATAQAVLTFHGAQAVKSNVINQPDWSANRFDAEIAYSFIFPPDDLARPGRLMCSVAKGHLTPQICQIAVQEFPFQAEILNQKVFRETRIEPEDAGALTGLS